ncbi:esterase [bacterium]|nr:esterase [bacterium]
MNRRQLHMVLAAGILLAAAALVAQPARPAVQPGDTLTSFARFEDGRVVFRIYAPKAEEVMITGSDMPEIGNAKAMTRLESGVWEIVLGPVKPGAYRYLFIVDGVPVTDPKNTKTSESLMNIWSLVTIPGDAFMDTKEGPYGAVSEITYYSASLRRFRRMHVYTPLGYEAGQDKYPVLYLLHGASDSDDSWTTVGRAGFILDNLIAAKQAVPMIVVMPAGHTRPWRWGQPLNQGGIDEFQEDFTQDIMPLIEARYRVVADKDHRALAGLSMGGAQTINAADKFAYLGVFSSGIFGIVSRNGRPAESPTWEEKNQDRLNNAELKKELKLLWFATGADDFLMETTRATVTLLRKYHFNVTFKETPGGHTWINWRQYLNEFVPMLFQE